MFTARDRQICQNETGDRPGRCVTESCSQPIGGGAQVAGENSLFCLQLQRGRREGMDIHIAAVFSTFNHWYVILWVPIPQIQSHKGVKYGAFIKSTRGILTFHKKISFSLPLHSNKLNPVSAGDPVRHYDVFNDIQLYCPSMPSPPSLHFPHPTITVVLSLFFAKLWITSTCHCLFEYLSPNFSLCSLQVAVRSVRRERVPALWSVCCQ